jgi:hypothetical protein
MCWRHKRVQVEKLPRDYLQLHHVPAGRGTDKPSSYGLLGFIERSNLFIVVKFEKNLDCGIREQERAWETNISRILVMVDDVGVIQGTMKRSQPHCN